MADNIKLHSGKEVYANRGILGISPDLELFEGYDGDIDTDELTVHELIELAEIAIVRWQAFREHYKRQRELFRTAK